MIQERMPYLDLMEEVPEVLPGDSDLVRNHKVLRSMLADLTALRRFRDEHRDDTEAAFIKAASDFDNLRSST